MFVSGVVKDYSGFVKICLNTPSKRDIKLINLLNMRYREISMHPECTTFIELCALLFKFLTPIVEELNSTQIPIEDNPAPEESEIGEDSQNIIQNNSNPEAESESKNKSNMIPIKDVKNKPQEFNIDIHSTKEVLEKRDLNKRDATATKIAHSFDSDTEIQKRKRSKKPKSLPDSNLPLDLPQTPKVSKKGSKKETMAIGKVIQLAKKNLVSKSSKFFVEFF